MFKEKINVLSTTVKTCSLTVFDEYVHVFNSVTVNFSKRFMKIDVTVG